MASIPVPSRRPDRAVFVLRPRAAATFHLHQPLMAAKSPLAAIAFAVVSLLFAVPPAARAQSDSPHIATVTPGSGKAEDTITITGQNLGKDKVAAVFLSDAKLDHKAVVMDQETTKIVIKVPAGLKAGDYNISVQEGAAIYIQPVIFTVKT
jgi:IPT/TIG domain